MTKNFLYLCYFIGFWFTSCHSGPKELSFKAPQFRDTVDIKGHILNDSFLMGAAFEIDVYKDYLILEAYTGSEGARIHFFDLSDGKHIKSILTKGRGPGEVMSVTQFDVDPFSGNVLFYDVMSYRLFQFNIDSVIHHEDPVDYISGRIHPVYMYAAYWGRGNYLVKGGMPLKTLGKKVEKKEVPRFSLVQGDSVIFTYFNYPEVKVTGVPEAMPLAYTIYSHVSLSPDRKKLACALSLGAILEIFDVYEDKIVLNNIKGFYPPVFEIDKHKTIIPIPGQTIDGFGDLYVTDKYIYAPFHSEPGYDNLKNFAVFDWQGKGIRLYRTDYDLMRICVNEEKQKVYAIGRNSDHENLLLEFNLN